MRTILGLDLGTSSVGWALFELGPDRLPSRLIDLGVRHFEEVIEPKSKLLKNAKRRAARGLRKNLRRRRQRLDLLQGVLQRSGMAPEGKNPFGTADVGACDPYALRAKAAKEQVTLLELGRALYHLSRRRGFKSNRSAKMSSLMSVDEVRVLLSERDTKDGEEDQDKELKVTLQEIDNLRRELGNRTLGEYFFEQLSSGQKVRGRHTSRDMYEEEFEKIWSVQSQFHAELTQELKTQIAQAIFWQRPLKTQKFFKAPCSLEHKRLCSERAQLVAQRFRLWQDLANLEFTNQSTGELKALSLEEKQLLATKLDCSNGMKWSAVRSALRLSSDWTANLERSKKHGLAGVSTASAIRRKAPNLWDSLSEPGREELVELLLTISDRGKCYQALRKKYDLNPEEAFDLAVLELEPGTASLCARAMRRILANMQAGMSRSEAQIAAGYKPWMEQTQSLTFLPAGPDRKSITSPRVRKALNQTRLVVNAIVREYGRPSIIRIELARELSLTKKEAEKREKSMRQREGDNDRAREQLKAIGITQPSRVDLIWYRLAEQCNWICPYTGKAIGFSKESMAKFQIEHIVPYTRSVDDSFNNLTLCDSEMNALKGNRTPFEAFGETGGWEDMQGRVKEWKNGPGVEHKRKLFMREQTPDEESMVERQLNETKWICRSAAAFLRPLCDEIQTTKGQVTALLRSHWGLMQALPGNDSGEKIRDDLRHHAVDAVAVAFVDRSLFQRITRAHQRVEPLSDATAGKCPDWLQAQLRQRLSSVIISHETTRHLRGAFHEETALGYRAPKYFHTRKRLSDMSAKDIEAIADTGLRESARKALEAAGGKANVAFENGLVLGGPRKGKDGRPLPPVVAYRARIKRTLDPKHLTGVPADNPYKYFELGNNHHVEIFVDTKGNRSWRFVSTLEAATRARRQGQPVINASCQDGHSLAMWLAINDMVMVPDDPRKYFRVESLMPSNNSIRFREHTAAHPNNDEQRLKKSVNILHAVKLYVDPLGRVVELTKQKL